MLGMKSMHLGQEPDHSTTAVMTEERKKHVFCLPDFTGEISAVDPTTVERLDTDLAGASLKGAVHSRRVVFQGSCECHGGYARKPKHCHILLQWKGNKVLQTADDGGKKKPQAACWQEAASRKAKTEEVWGLQLQTPISWNSWGREGWTLSFHTPSPVCINNVGRTWAGFWPSIQKCKTTTKVSFHAI